MAMIWCLAMILTTPFEIGYLWGSVLLSNL